MADENKQIKINSPFERVPQHANDPGYGEVPPRPKIVDLFQIPKEPDMPNVELTGRAKTPETKT